MPKKNTRILTIILNLLFISVALSVFSQRSNFTNYSLEDGIPQSTVLTLYQDQDRVLWIGTQGGICKYNGNSFITYDTRHGLTDNHISSILQDSRGRHWIGHRYKGVTLKRGKEFRQLKFVNSRINAIKEDVFGNIWFATLDSSIYILPNKLEPIVENFVHISMQDYPGLEYIHDLAVIGPNEVWVSTFYGLRILKFEGVDRFSFSIEIPSNEFISTSRIYSIAKTDDNLVWLLLSDRLIRVNLSDNDFNSILEYPYKQDFIIDYISTLSVDRDGAVWGSHNNGVFRLAEGKYSYYSQKDGINDSQINTVLCDVEGNVWIGGTNAGVFKYSGDKFQILDVDSGLADNVVLTVIEDVKGNVWMGTNAGVSVFDGKKLKPFMLPGNLANQPISIIFQDSRENIWFADFSDNDLVRYNPNTNSFRNYTAKDGLNTTSAITINEDKNGHIWFGTLGLSAGRYTYPTENAPERFDNFTEEDGLGSIYLWTIYRDKKGNLWFGSDNAGVTKYDGKTFTTYNTEDGLNNLSAGAITDDNNNNIWIATIGGGVYKFDGTKFISYGVEDGLSSDNPYTIIADANNLIWIGTNTGIDKFDPVSEVFKHYGKDEGFMGIESNQNAICRGKEGVIWFGTVNGLVRFDPSLDKPNLLAPKTIIEDIELFFENVDFSDYSDSVDGKTYLPAGLCLPYNKNHLTFKFSGVSLSVPGNVKYQYILENFDPMWNPNTKSTVATYTNIPPGDYSFKVKACNNDDIWIDEPVVYSFVVLPPFWQTWWFRIVVILLFIAGLFAYVKMRLHLIKSQKLRLEQLVDEKTIELQLEAKERKKALQKAEQADKLKTAFLANMSHEIRTPVNAIVGFADLLKDKNLGEADRELYLKYIVNGGNSLMNLINDIIDISKIEAEQINILKEDCNLNSMMTEFVYDIS
ncbi:MAG: two-component regulator propeller domain-containing protein [Bacteroidales bacterium]